MSFCCPQPQLVQVRSNGFKKLDHRNLKNSYLTVKCFNMGLGIGRNGNVAMYEELGPKLILLLRLVCAN